MTLHPHVTAEEKDRAVATMPDFWDKVTLKLGAIESYRYDNPSRAAALADELCDMSKKPGPLPGLEMSDANLSRYWERVLIPQIAYVDTPKVQALLEQAAKDDFSRMQLVGAWSNLDIDKAIKMADQVLKDEPDAAYGPHDQSIDDSYVEFLTNLAKTDPNAAARRLVAFKLVPTIYPESDDGGMLYIVALDIVRALWRQYPDQARDFCAQPMPWRKEFGPKPGDLVDCLEMNEQIRKNPLHSEARLKKFLAKVPDGFGYLLGMGPIETTSAVCQSLARKDPGAAIRISALQCKGQGYRGH